jgi:hypothetical protein
MQRQWAQNLGTSTAGYVWYCSVFSFKTAKAEHRIKNQMPVQGKVLSHRVKNQMPVQGKVLCLWDPAV